MCVLVTQLCLTLCDPMNCIACQVLHPWEFSKEEYWSRLLFPPPGDLPNPGLNSHILHWQVDSVPMNHLGSPERMEKRDELGIWDLHMHTVTDKIDDHQGSTV